MNNNESYVENFNEICIVKIVIPFSLLLSEIKNEITHDRHCATEIHSQSLKPSAVYHSPLQYSDWSFMCFMLKFEGNLILVSMKWNSCFDQLISLNKFNEVKSKERR